MSDFDAMGLSRRFTGNVIRDFLLPMTIVIFSVLALAFSILPIPDRLNMVRRRGNLSFI